MTLAESGSVVTSLPVDAEAMKIRLETAQVIQEIDLFLRGKVVNVSQEKDGTYVQHLEDTGVPMVNDRGRQHILFWLRSRVNTPGIMGNLKTEERFDHFIADLTLELSQDMTLNSKFWGVNENCLQLLHSSLIDMVELVLSRTLENEERKSLTGYREVNRHEVHDKKIPGSV